MVKLPTRASIRSSPIASPRLLLYPIDASDAQELWLAVEESRNYLYPWLPWVPFQRDEPATLRFAEACVADWGRWACNPHGDSRTRHQHPGRCRGVGDVHSHACIL